MDSLASFCGVYDCVTCTHRHSGECVGCCSGNEMLQASNGSVCHVYECVLSHGLTTCLECTDPSCAHKRGVELICPLRSQFEKRRWWAGRMSRAMETRGRSQEGDGVSDRIVNRLRLYLLALDTFAEEGHVSVPSWELAERVGVNAALVRKDLSKFGGFGTPSFGYKVEELRVKIRKILHLDKPSSIVWVGARCYREQSASLDRIACHGCEVIAVFDPDPSEFGECGPDMEVLPVDRLADTVTKVGATAAVISVAGPQAQTIAEVLTAAGVRAILNLSGEMLVLPNHIRVTDFHLAGELLELCYYCETS